MRIPNQQSDWLRRIDARRSYRRAGLSTTANATRYSEGDPVQSPQGFGIIAEVRTEGFEGKDGTVEASESSPTYVVALKDARVGVGFYRASELESTEMPETDIDDPVEQVANSQTANSTFDQLLRATGLRSNDWSMPKSWRESSTPARVILLKAWAGMGGTFRGARRELGSKRLAAAMKDEVLQWEGWRE